MNISSSISAIPYSGQSPQASNQELNDGKPSARQHAVPPVEEAAASAKSTDQSNLANKDAKQAQQQRVEKLKELQDQAIITKLKARDREVRAHEAAHAAVGGQYAGAPTYTYQRGPNGVSYAVGGEVKISTSRVEGDPEATLQKAMQVQRAALAPAEPSSQDRKVAAQASQMAAQARIDIAAQMQAEQTATRSSAVGSETVNSSADSENVEETNASAQDQSSKQNVDVAKLLADAGVTNSSEPGKLLDRLA